jgi:hypothetical protein
MEYKEIVAVTGLGGLYQLLATKSDGAIVRNLADQTTKFISARLHNVTPLESIEVYTTGENVRLHHVFQKMKDNEGTVKPVDGKKADNAAIKNYFKTIFPEFDEERVYVSDMKKMLKWYEILKERDLLHFEDETTQESEATEAETKKPAKKAAKAESADDTAASTEDAPVKKSRSKKAADPAAEEGEEKPAKKAAPKKKKAESEGAEEKPAKKTAAKKKEA